MPISNELKEIYSGADLKTRHIETISFSHPAFPNDFHFCNDVEDWRFKDENGASIDFVAFPFVVELPKQDGLGMNELTISVANAGLEMMSSLEAAQADPNNSIQAVYRVYRDIVDDTPQIDPPITMEITNMQANLTSVTATATRFNILGRLFPRGVYTVASFPGLDR